MSILPAKPRFTPRAVATTVRRRVRPHSLAVLQTATAAVAAWCLALLLLPTDKPAFASIAAIICVGATYGQRRRRAVELISGVVLGIAIASVLIFVIGTGPLQIARARDPRHDAPRSCSAAASCSPTRRRSRRSCSLSIEPATSGFSADRILEGMIGGGVGLAVASLLLPPDPATMVGQVAQTVFGKLGRALEETAEALDAGDPGRAEHALISARTPRRRRASELEDVLSVAVETARFSPTRRSGLELMQRYERDDAAARLRGAQHARARALRGAPGPPGRARPGLGGAVRELASSVWVLAALYEQPERTSDLREVAARRRARGPRTSTSASRRC